MKKQQQTTRKDWAKGLGLGALFVAFVAWTGGWWGLLFLPLILDAYITKKINWGWWRELENPITRTLMSWLDAIVFALVAVYFVNLYFFQNYVIPSSSLEKSLLVGDYLFVSKTSYGPRKPITPLSMPLTQHTIPFFGGIKSYIEHPQWDYERISPKRVPLNDIVVFNYPAGDTVALNYQNNDYYMMAYQVGAEMLAQQGILRPDSMSPLQKRAYFAMMKAAGKQVIADNPAQFGKVVTRPIDRQENYVKRCVGTPGQTLEIRNRIIYLDGKANPEPKDVQYNYRVRLTGRTLPQDFVREIGLSRDDETMLYGQGIVPLTKHMVQQLRRRTDLVQSLALEPQSDTDMLYPQNGDYGWTCDNYGPIWIPAKGESIRLTPNNLPIYERVITAYEGHSLQLDANGNILIDGKPCQDYTFQQDYYWMMGDNRHNSADSRYWGFVPETHIVGKPIMIWLSTDKDYGLLNGGIRWSRLFRWVK